MPPLDQQPPQPTKNFNNPMAEMAVETPRPKHFLFTLAILLILTAIFAGWYFFIQQPVEESVIENFVKNDETENWQTYRNEEYGFEFRYPGGFDLDNHVEGSLYFGGPEYGFSVDFVESANLTLEEYQKKALSINTGYEDETINIRRSILSGSNREWVLLEFRKDGGKYFGEIHSFTYLTVAEGNLYSLSFENVSDLSGVMPFSNKSESEISEIISTFKFIN